MCDFILPAVTKRTATGAIPSHGRAGQGRAPFLPRHTALPAGSKLEGSKNLHFPGKCYPWVIPFSQPGAGRGVGSLARHLPHGSGSDPSGARRLLLSGFSLGGGFPPWRCHPQTPPALQVSYLRCDVVRGAAEGLGGDPIPDVLLAHAKVGDLDVPFAVQHHVVQLQVPTMSQESNYTDDHKRGHTAITNLLTPGSELRPRLTHGLFVGQCVGKCVQTSRRCQDEMFILLLTHRNTTLGKSLLSV